jgi:hypothetical protein
MAAGLKKTACRARIRLREQKYRSSTLLCLRDKREKKGVRKTVRCAYLECGFVNDSTLTPLTLALRICSFPFEIVVALARVIVTFA